MWLSGCGYACFECVYRETGKCLGCSPENKLTTLCKIYECLERRGYSSCLRCTNRLRCKTYSTSLKHCPIRRSISSTW